MTVRIAIIEDNPDSRELMAYLLKSFGYEAVVAENGRAGVDIIGRERPDLAICDIQMPGMDGFEVARLVKVNGELGKMPLIAITALAMVGDRERVLAAGFDGYITKPISPDTFVSEVEQFLTPEQRLGEQARAWTHAADRPEPGLQKEEGGGRCGTILAVDNNRSNLELAASMFEPLGYRVLTADGGEEGLSEARRSKPDLILCDVAMPRCTGYDLVEAVKADPELRATPVILISSSRLGDPERARAVGAARYLRRPIDPDVMIRQVEQCLREARRKPFSKGACG